MVENTKTHEKNLKTYTIIETNEWAHWAVTVTLATQNWKDIYVAGCKKLAVQRGKSEAEISVIENEECNLISDLPDNFQTAKDKMLAERGAYVEIIEGGSLL